MNNDDERDFEEERANRQMIEDEQRAELQGEAETVDHLIKAERDREKIWLGAKTYVFTDELDDGNGPHYADASELPPGKTDFYFTFGLSAKLVAYNRDLAFSASQSGIPLARYYVRIDAENENWARAEMTRRWADCWAFCYDRTTFGPKITKGQYIPLPF
jgi:hypothetical protein